MSVDVSCSAEEMSSRRMGKCRPQGAGRKRLGAGGKETPPPSWRHVAACGVPASRHPRGQQEPRFWVPGARALALRLAWSPPDATRHNDTHKLGTPPVPPGFLHPLFLLSPLSAPTPARPHHPLVRKGLFIFFPLTLFFFSLRPLLGNLCN